MKSNHKMTPGPWFHDCKPGLPRYVYAKQGIAGSIPSTRRPIADVCGLEDGGDNESCGAEADANARAIAELPNVIAAADAMVRKIEPFLPKGLDSDERKARVAFNNLRAALAKATGE